MIDKAFLDSEGTSTLWEKTKGALEEKQPKLTGAPGQLVGFDAAGYAEAQEAQSFEGPQGVTFIPSVSEDGVISWENDGNLPNPDPVNIMGPAGSGPSLPEPPKNVLAALLYTDRNDDLIWRKITINLDNSASIGFIGTKTDTIPDTLYYGFLPPTDGTTGYVFTKTATGAEWAPAPSPTLPNYSETPVQIGTWFGSRPRYRVIFTKKVYLGVDPNTVEELAVFDISALNIDTATVIIHGSIGGENIGPIDEGIFTKIVLFGDKLSVRIYNNSSVILATMGSDQLILCVEYCQKQ